MTLGQDEAETFELGRNVQSIGSALGGTRSTAWVSADSVGSDFVCLEYPGLSVVQDIQVALKAGTAQQSSLL